MTESDPKKSILVLCNYMNLVCKYKMKPIYFRFAKNNKTEDNVVCKFWNLLNKFTDSPTNDNVVQNVKIYFAGLNYKSLEFYSLPNDMSTGSRELILAFSWLIGKHKILECLMKKTITKSIISQEFIVKTNNYYQPPLNYKYEHFTMQDYHNNVIILSGKINTNLKLLAEYNEKILKLMEKIHKLTSLGVSTHLSVAETHLIKNSNSFNIYLNEIKNISELLDAYSKWIAKEKIFWDWMITVVNLKSEDKNDFIDKEVLGSFFKELRIHAKQLLAKDPPQKFEILDENKFLRCLKKKETFSKHSQTMLIRNEKYLKEISNQEKNNVQQIINYLCTIIK